MGRQKSVVQLTGSIGNLTFYKTKDGFLARQRGDGISRARMNSDPKFARTLENMSEFGRANQAARLVRIALRDQVVTKSDRFMSRRLSSAMMEVLKSDPTNGRGSRQVHVGDLEKLVRFEFNENGKVFSSFYAPFTTAIDRATGAFSLDVPAFAPAKRIVRPEGATHFRIRIGATSLDFDDNSYLTATAVTPEIDVRAQEQEAIQLSTQLFPNLETQLMLTVAIEFAQVVNGTMYELSHGNFNGVAVVEIDQILR